MPQLSFRILPAGLVLLAVLFAGQPARAGQLDLTWVDNSAGAASFRVERKAGVDGLYAQLARLAPGVVSYVDASVVSGTTYCYRVQAYDAVGTSPYSNEACASLSSGGLDLTVSVSGTGRGAVTSSPAGINCGPTCAGSYPSGAVVTLTATAAAGSSFSRWTGGGCSGTGSCTLAGNAPVAVSASFAAGSGSSGAGSGSFGVSQLQFSASGYTVDEGSSVTVRVTRSGNIAGGVTVNYATSDGTATAGVDYTATAGTLTFGRGVSNREIRIPTTTNKIVDGARTVTLTLSNPTGRAVFGTPSTTVVTITFGCAVSTWDEPGWCPVIDKILTDRVGRTYRVVRYGPNMPQARLLTVPTGHRVPPLNSVLTTPALHHFRVIYLQ